MPNFFTSDINVEDIRSPREILDEAARELERRAATVAVTIREVELDDRIVLAFAVFNQECDLEHVLFEVMHRRRHSYPVSICPPAFELPEFLQRRRFEPTFGDAMRAASGITSEMLAGTGRFVENEWVCATPREFSEKLRTLFALDNVKAQLLSVIAPHKNRLSTSGISSTTTNASAELPKS
jgi:hypothetical protein